MRRWINRSTKSRWQSNQTLFKKTYQDAESEYEAVLAKVQAQEKEVKNADQANRKDENKKVKYLETEVFKAENKKGKKRRAFNYLTAAGCKKH